MRIRSALAPSLYVERKRQREILVVHVCVYVCDVTTLNTYSQRVGALAVRKVKKTEREIFMHVCVCTCVL